MYKIKIHVYSIDRRDQWEESVHFTKYHLISIIISMSRCYIKILYC